MSRFIKSLGYAINGLKSFILKEKNGQIQFIATCIAIVVSFLLQISHIEWCIVLLCIAGVLSLEMINSSLEKTLNHLHPEKHNNIKIIKDIAAGAVLWFSIISATIAVIIFLPKIIKL